MSGMLTSYLSLAAVLFSIGLYGALSKRNAIIVLLSIELMLGAVSLNLIAFSKYGAMPSVTGQIFSLFNITVAAAEAAVGVAILIAYYRNKGSSDVTEMNELSSDAE